MVRGGRSSKPAGDLNAALRASNIKELPKKPMTAKEMGLNHGHMLTLKSTGIVRRLRYADRAHKVAVWTVGPKFPALIRNWERWV
jgi:hypothetical protein